MYKVKAYFVVNLNQLFVGHAHLGHDFSYHSQQIVKPQVGLTYNLNTTNHSCYAGGLRQAQD